MVSAPYPKAPTILEANPYPVEPPITKTVFGPRLLLRPDFSAKAVGGVVSGPGSAEKSILSIKSFCSCTSRAQPDGWAFMQMPPRIFGDIINTFLLLLLRCIYQTKPFGFGCKFFSYKGLPLLFKGSGGHSEVLYFESNFLVRFYLAPELCLFYGSQKEQGLPKGSLGIYSGSAALGH